MALRLSSRCCQMSSTFRRLLRTISRNDSTTNCFSHPSPAFNGYLRSSARRLSLNFASEKEGQGPYDTHLTFGELHSHHDDLENYRAFSVLCRNREFSATAQKLREPPKGDIELIPEEISLMTWSGKPHELVSQFERISNMKKPPNCRLNQDLFTPMITALSSNLKQMNDGEIYCILQNLLKWPLEKTLEKGNYLELWKAIDKECQCRISLWSRSQILSFALPFYFLRLIRRSDFVYTGLKKVAKKIPSLSVHEFIQLVFYLNVARYHHPALKPYEVEFAVINNFSKFSLEELGVIALGFFKSQNKFKEEALVNAIIKKLIEELDTASSYTLVALLKIIRYSARYQSLDHMKLLLRKIGERSEKYSLMELTHVASLASKWFITTEELHKHLANKLRAGIKSARIKDIVHIVNCLASNRYECNENPSIFEVAVNEFRNPDREAEIMRHPVTLEHFLCKLSVIPLYPDDLISKVFSTEFLHHAHGKKLNRFTLPAHLLQLHFAVSLEHPSYQGPLFDPDLVDSICGQQGWFLPRQTGSVQDRMAWNVINLASKVLGGDDYVTCIYALPSFFRYDIIFCLDEETNKPLPIPEDLKTRTYLPGVLPSNQGKWHCVYGIGQHTALDNMETVGYAELKRRLLSKIGYKPILWNIGIGNWLKLTCEKEKEQTVKELIGIR